MMYMPKLNRLPFKKDSVDRFGGINRTSGCERTQFYDTVGLSSRDHPALSSAPCSYELGSMEAGTAARPLFFLNGRIGCLAALREDHPDIRALFYGGKRVSDVELREGISSLGITAFNGKTLIVKGNTAYEFEPEAALSKMGYTLNIQPAHADPQYNEATLRISLLYEDMSEVGHYSTGGEGEDFPSDASVGDCFARYTQCYRLLYKDIDGEDIWQPVVSFRLRLDIGDGYRNFKAGDHVRLDGLKYWNWAVRELDALNRFVRIDALDEEKRYITEAIPVFDNFSIILDPIAYPTNDIGYGSPIIDNQGNSLYLLGGSVSACMPEMDFICTGANRVWGCSNTNREIYASELGNARNWSVFEGLSGDSYAVSVGSEGDFTACCNYLGTPIFFKENEMIVITGSRPASFTLNSYSIRGVRADSPDGICVVGDTLYYMAYDGVYAYNGSAAVCISRELGEEIRSLENAVFGGEGDILYVSGEVDGRCLQYTYDTRHKIWHGQRPDRVFGYLRYPDATLRVSERDGMAVISTLGAGIPLGYTAEETKVIDNIWCWETRDLSYGSADKKYIRRVAMDTACQHKGARGL